MMHNKEAQHRIKINNIKAYLQYLQKLREEKQ